MKRTEAACKPKWAGIKSSTALERIVLAAPLWQHRPRRGPQRSGVIVSIEKDPILSKLPVITAIFWMEKIAATTLGETAGDLLSVTLNVGYGVSSAILIGLFFIVLASQMVARNYHPFLYWTAIVATSTAGTTMSDYMDRTLELGYARGSLILVAILLAIFAVWRLSGYSPSLDKIRSRRVELLYWVAILFSNALGTALGDFVADDSGLGFSGGALLMGGLLALILATTSFTRISRVFLFWIAFVLTRPFGTTMGDVLTKTIDQGGLGFGTIGASAIIAAALIALIVEHEQDSSRGNPGF